MGAPPLPSGAAWAPPGRPHWARPCAARMPAALLLRSHSASFLGCTSAAARSLAPLVPPDHVAGVPRVRLPAANKPESGGSAARAACRRARSRGRVWDGLWRGRAEGARAWLRGTVQLH